MKVKKLLVLSALYEVILIDVGIVDWNSKLLVKNMIRSNRNFPASIDLKSFVKNSTLDTVVSFFNHFALPAIELLELCCWAHPENSLRVFFFTTSFRFFFFFFRCSRFCVPFPSSCFVKSARVYARRVATLRVYSFSLFLLFFCSTLCTRWLFLFV